MATPKKKSPSPASIISPPSAGKPLKGTLSRSEEVAFFNRVGCLCSICGASLFGPCTTDKELYESFGEIRQLEHQKSSKCIPALCIPLCKNCNKDTYDQKDLIEFKKCAEQRARLNLGVPHNDHSIVVSGIIIVKIRKLKAMIKRSPGETDDIKLLEELQFINFGDLHNLMPDVVKEIIFLYYEFILKFKNYCKKVKEILQHLMFTVQYAIIGHHKQEINLRLLDLCKILSEAASSEHCKDDESVITSLIYSILNLLVPMIKQDRIEEIEKVLGTNLVNYIKERKLQ